MRNFDKLIEELKKEVQEYKRITNKRLEQANELVNDVIAVIKEAGLQGDNDIDLFDCNGLGLRYRGANNIGYWLYLIELETYRALPESTKDIDRGTYIAGNFNAYVRYMDTVQTLETLKKLPEWVKCVKEKIRKIKEKYENIELPSD